MSSPGPVSIRRAGRDDAAAMAELARIAYQKYVARVGREPAPMTADYDETVNRGQAWVAEREGRIVGLLVLEPAQDHLLLENVAVHPQAQGLGIGGRLMRLAEEQARAGGFAEVRLYTHETMTENQAYYERLGYVETHRGSTDGFGRVHYAKALGPP